MKKSFTLLILSGLVGAVACVFTRDVTVLTSTTASTSLSRGLTTDCNLLLREHDRVRNEIVNIERLLEEFKNLSAKDHSTSFLNRAAAWCKTALYTINNHLKHITNSYEHCTCEAGKITVPAELKVLLEKIQKDHFLLIKQINALKTMLTSFQNQMKFGLN
jgi:hypothetical protein